jgi:hypothetical protein
MEDNFESINSDHWGYEIQVSLSNTDKIDAN